MRDIDEPADVAGEAIASISDAFSAAPSERTMEEAVAEHLTGIVAVDSMITRWADLTLRAWSQNQASDSRDVRQG